MIETDLDLLEAYLDGEMPMADAEILWRRLSAEPELAAALNELREQRAIRQAVWERFEPADTAATAVARRVCSSARRQRVVEGSRRGLVYLVSAAACLFLGVRIGWMTQTAPEAPAMSVQPVSAIISDPSGRIVARPQFDSPQDFNAFVNDLRNSRMATPSRDLGDGVVQVSDEQY